MLRRRTAWLTAATIPALIMAVLPAAGASAQASSSGGGLGLKVDSSLETQQGTAADAPLCLSCGVKMRPAGSCYVCEGCGSTSGCS